eukprot:GHRR01024159.1.p3 GENE.GHRR01024159.1~~GHRR01024159.1.p3  ORF type:complete len:102 (-),score=21.02 GHRR01024159.1:2102-2407(-)
MASWSHRQPEPVVHWNSCSAHKVVYELQVTNWQHKAECVAIMLVYAPSESSPKPVVLVPWHPHLYSKPVICHKIFAALHLHQLLWCLCCLPKVLLLLLIQR